MTMIEIVVHSEYLIVNKEGGCCWMLETKSLFKPIPVIAFPSSSSYNNAQRGQ